MRLAHLLALAWLAWQAAAPAAESPAEESWTCVPGENGRWRCGPGANEPPTSPLPELRTPADAAGAAPAVEPQPGSPSIFILDRPASRASPLDLPVPEPERGAFGQSLADPGAPFALKIASVSDIEEVPAFVDSYGLDPKLVRHVDIKEAGATRQIILWGEFSSSQQARRAVAGLPSVVRSMRPQVVRADQFEHPARWFQDEAGAPRRAGQSPRPGGREVVSLATATAIDEPTEQAGLSAGRDATPALPRPATGSRTASVSPADDSDPADEPGADLTPTPVPTPAPTRAPTVDSVAADSTASRSDPADEPGAGPTQTPAPARPPPEPRSRAAIPPAPSDTAADHAARPAPRATARPTPATRPASPVAGRLPARQEAAPRPAAPPGRGPAEFLELDAGAYTVQLTSLANDALIARYLQHHGLDPGRVFRVQVDEGAGPRWLLLWEAYPSVRAAEAGRRALPESVRSPWVRRVQPLKERLGLQLGHDQSSK